MAVDEEEKKDDVSVQPFIKYSVYVGIFLIRLLDCLPWLWGNMSVYVISYYHHQNQGQNAINVLTNWILVVNVTGFNLGMLISGWIGRTIGDIPTLFLSIVLANAGLYISYFTLDYSAIAFCITFAGMTGLSGGFSQSMQMTLIVRWTKRYHGFATSSVASSNILVSVLVNLVVSWYVNPSNRQPDISEYNMLIFSQKDLIERVPSSILYYAIASSVFNVAGFVLLRDRPGCKDIFTEMYMCCQRFHQRNKPEEKIALTKSNEIIVTTPTSKSTNPTPQQIIDNDVTCIHDESSDVNGSTASNTIHKSCNILSSSSLTSSNYDVTPRQVLKRKDFYVLWISVAVQTYAFFLINTYYKIFGLLYIPDDHFLTTIVAIKCMVTPACTWLAGISVDKFGVKPTTVVISSLFCVVSSLFFLTPHNKWLYLVSCLAYGGTLFTLYCLTAACCVKLFGQTYFTSILGMCLTSTYVLTFTVPILTGWIIATYGWLVLFLSAGVLAFVNVLVLVAGLTEK